VRMADRVVHLAEGRLAGRRRRAPGLALQTRP
jgi:hypothetical protein